MEQEDTSRQYVTKYKYSFSRRHRGVPNEIYNVDVLRGCWQSHRENRIRACRISYKFLILFHFFFDCATATYPLNIERIPSRAIQQSRIFQRNKLRVLSVMRRCEDAEIYSDLRLVQVSRVPTIEQFTHATFCDKTHKKRIQRSKIIYIQSIRERKKYWSSSGFPFLLLVQRRRRLKNSLGDEPFQFSSFMYSLVKLHRKLSLSFSES